jgi:hypothetical protein
MGISRLGVFPIEKKVYKLRQGHASSFREIGEDTR